MAEGSISFFEPIRVDGFLYLGLTKKPVESEEYDWLRHQKKYLGYLRDSAKGERIILCAKEKELVCTISDGHEKTLTVIAVNPLDFRTHSALLRHGIQIEVEETVVNVRLKNGGSRNGLYTDQRHIEWPEKASDGTAIRFENYWIRDAVSHTAELLKELHERMSMASETEGDEDAEESYTPHQSLEKMLSLAERYSYYEHEIAERAWQKPENMLDYTRIEPLAYDRRDRTAYSFFFPARQDFEERSFASRQQVEVYDDNVAEQPSHTAEVITLVKGGEENRIDLLFKGQVGIDDFSPTGGNIRLCSSTVVRDVQQDAVRKLRSRGADCPARYMDAVFGTHELLGFDAPDLRALEAELQSRGLRPAQIQAVMDGIRSRDIYLVMGPPGTGKTTVITEWVKHFVRAKKCVLISSQNNKAVDNVLVKLKKEQDINMIRIGSEEKVEQAVHPYLFEHKVEETRRRIEEQSAENIARLHPIEEQWRELQGRLDALSVDVKSMDVLLQKVWRELLPPLRASGEQMANAYAAHRAAAADAAEKRADVRRRYERIAGYATEGLAGLWGRLRRMIDQYPMRRAVRAYDLARAEELASCSAYNAARRSYEQQYRQVYENEFIDLVLRKRYCQPIFDGLRAEVEEARPGSDIPWTFFVMDYPQEMTREGVESYAAFVTGELHRLSTLLAHLEEWRRKNATDQDYSLGNMILSSVDLVGATCIGVNSQRRFADLKFDVTIIDEAGQIQIHNALVPMSVSNKLIMVGDHQQIPPIASEELVELCRANDVDTELLGKSLFEKMYEDKELPAANKMMLDTQFRMPPEIAAIISRAFYGGNYISLPNFKAHVTSLFPALSAARLVVISTSDARERFEQNMGNAGTRNDLEAQITARILRGILRQTERTAEDIGVISAYKAQVVAIRALLDGVLTPKEREDSVATLDSFQGQERDIILYSFTRSARKPPGAPRIGFMSELRRLNVAVTRCKKMLILIGDMDFLQTCEYVHRDEEGQEVPGRSEAKFAAFIRALMDGVRTESPPGECMTYAEFRRRMEAVEHGR